MDDILASIRRILSDEEKAVGKTANDSVLMLDPSMMVDQAPASGPPAPAETEKPAPQEAEPASTSETGLIETHASAAPDETQTEMRQSEALMSSAPGQPESLVAPEAAAAAASSVGTLMRTLVAERNAVVHRGGPSIEDLVREEIRPLLKEWLDNHLPGMVERLVRAEIERVVGRITG